MQSRKENVEPLPMFHTREDGKWTSDHVLASYE